MGFDFTFSSMIDFGLLFVYGMRWDPDSYFFLYAYLLFQQYLLKILSSLHWIVGVQKSTNSICDSLLPSSLFCYVHQFIYPDANIELSCSFFSRS